MSGDDRHVEDVEDGPCQPSGPIAALIAEILAPDRPNDTSRRPLSPGELVGRFEIVREIGRGGFGVVYEARDRELGRSVALKLMRFAGREDLGDRLVQEGEAAAHLAHPNIVTLFDLGRCEQGPYLVMELLQGRCLRRRLADGPLSVREGLRICAEVARALEHAHGRGVFHRDLTPGNVFLCADGGVKVLDFGLAHAFGRRRASGGTPAYMSPEQCRDAPEDERTDIFALGVMLYEMLTGDLPYPADVADSRRWSRRPRQLEVPGAPALGPLITRMLSEDPTRRPRGVAEVREALSGFHGELERSGSPGPRVHRRGPGWPRFTGLAAAGMILGAALAWFAASRHAKHLPQAGPTVVAVADFSNETDEPDLDALSGLLITSLEQSRRLSVLSRSRMFDLARQLGHPDARRMDERLARDVGRRAGAHVVLVPAVRRLRDGYGFELRALAPDGQGRLFTLSGEARGRESVPDAIDRMSERVRLELQERPSEVNDGRVRVADAVTASLESYRHYFLAQQLDDEDFDAPRALAEYKRALEIDPRLAVAHLAIAEMAAWHEAPGEDEEAHIAAAAEQAHRLPEKERRLLVGVQRYLQRDFAGAAPVLTRLAQDFPQEKEVLYVAGETLWHGGTASGPARAVALFRQALDLDPNYLVAAIHLFQWLGRYGPPDEALSRARRAARLRPGPMPQAMVARALAYAGDLVGALDAAQRAAGVGEGMHFESSYVLAEILAFGGREEEAERELRRWMRPEVAAGHRRIAGEFMPILLAGRGRQREALAAWAELAAEPRAPDERDFDALMRVHLALAGGDVAAAREALRAWRPANEAEADRSAWLWAFLGDSEGGAARAARLERGSSWEMQHASAAALSQGRFLDAVATLEPLTQRDASLEPVFLLGQALAGAGRDAEAIAAFEVLENAYPLYAPFWHASLRPASFLLAAECHLRLGQREEAVRKLDALLRLLRHADADLPLLRSARGLRALAASGLPARSARSH